MYIFRRLGLHINGVWPVFLLKTAIFSSNDVIMYVDMRNRHIGTMCIMYTCI